VAGEEACRAKGSCPCLQRCVCTQSAPHCQDETPVSARWWACSKMASTQRDRAEARARWWACSRMKQSLVGNGEHAGSATRSSHQAAGLVAGSQSLLLPALPGIVFQTWSNSGTWPSTKRWARAFPA